MYLSSAIAYEVTRRRRRTKSPAISSLRVYEVRPESKVPSNCQSPQDKTALMFKVRPVCGLAEDLEQPTSPRYDEGMKQEPAGLQGNILVHPV